MTVEEGQGIIQALIEQTKSLKVGFECSVASCQEIIAKLEKIASRPEKLAMYLSSDPEDFGALVEDFEALMYRTLGMVKPRGVVQ